MPVDPGNNHVLDLQHDKGALGGAPKIRVRHAVPLGALYVGSSWYDPAERMRQHHDGYQTGSSALRGRCRRPRPELYLDIPWHWDRREAIAMENRRARRLAEAGFLVRCDRRLHPPASRRVPFTAADVERVISEFERVIVGLVAGTPRRLSLDEVVRALRWTPREPSLSDFIAVPNDHVGRFSHVDEHAVSSLAQAVMHRQPQRELSPRVAS
jgi:hypothetical protein